MKKGICFVMTAALCAMLLTACGNNSGQSDNANGKDQSESSSPVQSSQAEDKAKSQDNGVITGTEEQPGKVLVVYYSASGNTKAAAETIVQYTGGDTFEIVPVEEYTSE